MNQALFAGAADRKDWERADTYFRRGVADPASSSFPNFASQLGFGAARDRHRAVALKYARVAELSMWATGLKEVFEAMVAKGWRQHEIERSFYESVGASATRVELDTALDASASAEEKVSLILGFVLGYDREAHYE